MNDATADNAISLWPTIFLYYVAEDHEKYGDALAVLAVASPGSDILGADDPTAAWLRSEIHGAATAYLERCAEGNVAAFGITSRAVVQGFADYQPLTNHPDAYLSGIYTVTAPTDLRETHHRSDAASGAISYYDPRFAMNMNAIARDPNKEVEKIIRPEPGSLILWPSFVDFFVHPNLSSKKRISIHFKVTVERGA